MSAVMTTAPRLSNYHRIGQALGLSQWTHNPAPDTPLSTLPTPGGKVTAPMSIDQAIFISEQWPLLRQLDALQHTPESDRWPTADWPSDRAFADARSFICRLPAGAILPPNMGLADDGEISFLWDSDAVHIDLGMYGTGTFSYFARTGDGQKFYGDDCPAAHGLPADIARLIQA